MRFSAAFLVFPMMLGFPRSVCPQTPIIPPTIARISPAGMEKGKTVTFTLDGRSLSDASTVIFDANGLTGKVIGITDIAEKIAGPRAGEDLGAQVPLGKKQVAAIAITAGNDVSPGIHRFRVKTPWGTSNTVAFAVGMLHEVQRQQPANDSDAHPQTVQLPATLVGTIASTGERHSYQFDGKSGEEFVVVVQASELGSKLSPLMLLTDKSGQTLATSNQTLDSSETALNCRLPESGQYTLTISDRNLESGTDHFYRMDAGELPYVTSVFPLGARTEHLNEIEVKGANLGSETKVKLQPAGPVDGWATVAIDRIGQSVRPVNSVTIALGNEPDLSEREPNDTILQAQAVTLPVTIDGRIDGGKSRGGDSDEDYFRFHANKGERVTIEVAAARLGSSLDSVIEILDPHGNAIPRATIRCLTETTTTLADRDSRTTGIRLVSTAGLRQGDYIMVGDELDQIDFIPDQPDADTILKSMGDLRLAYLGTSPDVHAVNTPVYKAQIMAPEAEVPSNGLPVFHLSWRNDDGGPGYGADSKLEFDSPADGDYYLHLKDIRNLEGSDFPYRIVMRDQRPDFRLTSEPANPNIPLGGSVPLTVSLDDIRGFDGPIELAVEGLPPGVTAASARIAPGQTSTVLVLTASSQAAADTPPAPIKVVGRAVIEGRQLVRIANRSAHGDQPLQLASIIPPPDVDVTTEPSEVALAPGKEVTIKLNIARHNTFTGRVPCTIQNLPFGVRVVNVGLNGVLVTESQTNRTFTLRAEDWAKPINQPIFVVGEVESNSSTMHPSAPILLTVAPKKQSTSALAEQNASGR